MWTIILKIKNHTLVWYHQTTWAANMIVQNREMGQSIEIIWEGENDE